MKFIPAKKVLEEHVQFIYSCRPRERNGTHTPIVKAPPCHTPYIMDKKYDDGMPLYRLEQQHQNIPPSRQTMANWVMMPADTWLKPLYERMHQELVSRRGIIIGLSTSDMRAHRTGIPIRMGQSKRCFGHDTDTIRHDGPEELEAKGRSAFIRDRLLAFAS